MNANKIEKEANDLPLEIGFKRLTEKAVIPTKAHANDSGFDIYAAVDVIIAPNTTKIVPTNLAVKLPPGYDASIRDRSGISTKTKLRVVSPPIDNGYRGEVGIILDNIQPHTYAADKTLRLINGTTIETDTDFPAGTYLIRKGDRIAQMVIQPLPTTVAVEITGELDETERGATGYGASGVR